MNAYKKVMALGALNSTVRTPQQTEIALFWKEHTGQQYARAFQNLATHMGLGTLDTARFMPMLWTGFSDSGIACSNPTDTFRFWLPVPAIPVGRGNPALTPAPL